MTIKCESCGTAIQPASFDNVAINLCADCKVSSLSEDKVVAFGEPCEIKMAVGSTVSANDLEYEVQKTNKGRNQFRRI